MSRESRTPAAATAVAGEFELIERLAALFGPAPPGVVRAIGDDCAVLEDGPGHYLVWTIDTLAEGVHFDLGYISLHQLGVKTVAVNVSDIAAMGAEPLYGLLALGWPPGRDLAGALELGAGLREGAARYGAALIGGDTVQSPGGLSLSLTLLGRVRREEILLREGARPGDLVWVTGPLGEAAAGLEVLRRGLEVAPEVRHALVQAHLDPRPQVAAGRVLAASRRATAAIDLSDGVASDLYRLCRAAGAGAEVAAERLPIAPGVKQVAALAGREPWELALAGGEDYQLLFTAPPEAAAALEAEFGAAGLPPPTVIGRIIPGGGVFLDTAGGRREISGAGFDHFQKPRRQAPGSRE